MTRSCARYIRTLRICAVVLLSAWIGLATASQVRAAETHGKPSVAAGPQIDPGAGLIHGNYCGVGSRQGLQPVDALDAACMRHDACTRAAGLSPCSCNERLQREADAVARNPAQPPDVQLVASLTAAAAAVLICEPGEPRPAVPAARIRRSARE